MDENKIELNNSFETEETTETSNFELSDIDELDFETDNKSSQTNVISDAEIFDDSENFKIEITSTPEIEMSPKAKNKGLKVFVSLLCFLLALSIAVGAGYLAGVNRISMGSNNKLELAPKPQNDEILTTEEVYNSVSPSVVGIAVYNSNGVNGYASGVVYSEDGYIITNDHVYEDVKDAKFKIYDYSGNSYDAVYVAGDTRSDLAVLKINADGFFPAVFGNSAEINFGEEVVAIGRPSDPTDNSSITKGIVSYPNRRVSNSSNYSSRLIQTDSAINPGSSGGALVNMYGQVIGITSSKLVGNSYEGIGYAIPTVTVKKVVESLIEYGTVVNRGKLGFTYQEINSLGTTSEVTSHGLLVVSVSEDSDMFGKISAGDVITAVNGQQIVKDDVLIDILDSTSPGEPLNLEVLTKNGVTKQINVKVIQDSSSSSYESSEQGDLPLLP